MRIKGLFCLSFFLCVFTMFQNFSCTTGGEEVIANNHSSLPYWQVRMYDKFASIDSKDYQYIPFRYKEYFEKDNMALGYMDGEGLLRKKPWLINSFGRDPSSTSITNNISVRWSQIRKSLYANQFERLGYFLKEGDEEYSCQRLMIVEAFYLEKYLFSITGPFSIDASPYYEYTVLDSTESSMTVSFTGDIKAGEDGLVNVDQAHRFRVSGSFVLSTDSYTPTVVKVSKYYIDCAFCLDCHTYFRKMEALFDITLNIDSSRFQVSKILFDRMDGGARTHFTLDMSWDGVKYESNEKLLQALFSNPGSSGMSNPFVLYDAGAEQTYSMDEDGLDFSYLESSFHLSIADQFRKNNGSVWGMYDQGKPSFLDLINRESYIRNAIEEIEHKIRLFEYTDSADIFAVDFIEGEVSLDREVVLSDLSADIEYDFKFVNNSICPVSVIDVEPSCSCTGSFYSNDFVSVGDTSLIRLSVSARDLLDKGMVTAVTTFSGPIYSVIKIKLNDRF